jgi:hypothetical protein
MLVRISIDNAPNKTPQLVNLLTKLGKSNLEHSYHLNLNRLNLIIELKNLLNFINIRNTENISKSFMKIEPNRTFVKGYYYNIYKENPVI